MKRLSVLFAVMASPALAASGPFFSLRNTAFVVTLAFLVFVGILLYYRVPQIVGGLLDKRAEGIRNDLAEARRLREEAQEIYASYERRQREVKGLADQIVANAKRESSLEAEKAKAELKLSIARRLKAAEDQIASAEADAVRAVRDRAPQVVVVDPISNFISVGDTLEIKAMLVRLVDFLKTHQITAFLTSLNHGSEGGLEHTDFGVSSLIDTWLLLRDQEVDGERNRVLYLLKSRGMAHSNQVREFVLTDHGIELIDVYTGAEGVLTGSARLLQAVRRTSAAG